MGHEYWVPITSCSLMNLVSFIHMIYDFTSDPWIRAWFHTCCFNRSMHVWYQQELIFPFIPWNAPLRPSQDLIFLYIIDKTILFKIFDTYNTSCLMYIRSIDWKPDSHQLYTIGYADRYRNKFHLPFHRFSRYVNHVMNCFHDAWHYCGKVCKKCWPLVQYQDISSIVLLVMMDIHVLKKF